MLVGLVIIGSVLLYGLALFFGSDSRDGNDWIEHRAL
jgi:hypothetical protein